MSSGESHGWADEGLTRRLKALACTAPLHDLEIRKVNQPWLDGERYQMAEVALQIIDHVAIAMDFESGARHGEVLERARRFVARQAPERPVDEHARVAVWVLENLINTRDAERGFRHKYGSIDTSGDYVLKTFDFKILVERTDSKGDLYLKASDEALNVLVGALDTDVESAQIAAEVRLRNLIERGQFSDARLIAEQARVRTIQYSEIIRAHLEATERDVRTVDWMHAVPKLLNNALEHVEARVVEEQAIAESIRMNRDGTEDPGSKRRAAELVDIIEDCVRRHTELQRRLLGARSLFRGQQDRQQFSGRTRRAEVDLHKDLLRPVLAHAMAEVDSSLREFVTHSIGPELQDQVNLATLVPSLLAPPTVRSRFVDEEEDEPDTEASVDDPGFSPEQCRMAAELLDLPQAGRRLSDLLEEASLLDPELPELVALLALRAFSPQLGAALRHGDDRVLLSLRDGHEFESAGFAGDDLIVATALLDRNAVVTEGSEGSWGR